MPDGWVLYRLFHCTRHVLEKTPSNYLNPVLIPRHRHRTVQTQVLEVAVGEVVLHDGHERGHLTEQQHLVVGGPQLGQDTVQHLKLPRGSVQVKTRGRERTQPGQ